MIKVPVSQLKPGMKLAKDVSLEDGRLLLLAGFLIKPLYLRKLELFNIDSVYIENSEFTPIEESEEEVIYNKATVTVKDFFTLIKENKAADISLVKDTVSDVLEKVIENETIMLQLTGIRDIDNYTYLHSVDVCIYSTVIGKKIGYSKEPLTILGMGAILHDIGKCKIPCEILHKPDRLTDSEFDQIKLHPVQGCEIIKSLYRLSASVYNIAYQHHEKWDGSGYPLGLTGYSIDTLTRIVTISDVYDALTSDRVYKKRILPHIAAEYIKNNSGTLFDPYIVELFIESIAAYNEGTLVLLSTGELGSIISSKNKTGARQKVNVFSNRAGPPVLHPYIIDLNEREDVEIVEIFI